MCTIVGTLAFQIIFHGSKIGSSGLSTKEWKNDLQQNSEIVNASNSYKAYLNLARSLVIWG